MLHTTVGEYQHVHFQRSGPRDSCGARKALPLLENPDIRNVSVHGSCQHGSKLICLWEDYHFYLESSGAQEGLWQVPTNTDLPACQCDCSRLQSDALQ